MPCSGRSIRVVSDRFSLSHQGLFHVVPQTGAARGHSLSAENSLTGPSDSGAKTYFTLSNLLAPPNATELRTERIAFPGSHLMSRVNANCTALLTVTTNSPTFAHQMRCEAQFAPLAILLNR